MTKISENKKNRKDSKKKTPNMNLRFFWICVIFLGLFIIVAIRLIIVATFDGDKYSKAALSQVEQNVTTILSKRGDIKDRNGVVLATSNTVYNLILDPEVILTNEEKFLEPTISLIEEYFNIDKEELRQKIYDNPERNYVVLAKNLNYSDIEEFKAIIDNDGTSDENESTETNDADTESEKEESTTEDPYAWVAGVWLEENYMRKYPFDTMACSVIGFMENGKGAYGLEAWYNDELTGTDGREYTYVDNDNVLVSNRIEAENGCTLVMTIDYNVQTIVEEKMEEFLKDVGAKTVAVIIQNPNTGEIIAMADSDNFNCNSPRDLTVSYTQEEIAAMNDSATADALNTVWKNFCVTETYEPGSTYKPFTLAAGLEENCVSITDEYYCSGSKEFLEDTVRCHEHGGHGLITAKEAITYSCNVGLMEMAERIGVSNFCKYQRNFGFGKKTGIDLPNEMSCEQLLYTEENMTEIDLATNSFGQNFNLTMIQMSTAFSSLINGGYYYKPYIVKKIYNNDGEVVASNDKTLVARTVSTDVSDTVKECLRSVVVDGTGWSADIEGYKIAGKTGTAEKSGREDGIYLISFIGFAPYDNPEVLCYVAIDEPSTGDESGVASGLFNDIMTEVLPYLNIIEESENG